jgi:hypothetical protein
MLEARRHEREHLLRHRRQVIARRSGPPLSDTSASATGCYHNLLKHPDVEINVGPKRFPATARRVGPEDADDPRLWDACDQKLSDASQGGIAQFPYRRLRHISQVI